MSSSTTTRPVAAEPSRHAADAWRGERLGFVIGAFRSGTTLLRRMLDAHPRIVAPAETWFLLPLLDLWRGATAAAGYDPAQAAAALRRHVDEEGFRRCCRAFARAFYLERLPDATTTFVDKTPLYLPIAGEIASVLPAARFIVLARDPRGILASRATWRHASDPDPRTHLGGVAADVARLAAFLRAQPDRARLISYEALCAAPHRELRRATDFLGLPWDPAMIEYGAVPHHEGYGDENALAHDRPHVASIERWREVVDDAVAAELRRACIDADLATLGLDDFAALPRGAAPPAPRAAPASAPAAPATPAPTPAPPRRDARRILVLAHPGTNSRDHLADFVRGFRGAGHETLSWELEPILAMTRGGSRQADALVDAARLLRAFIAANGIDLVVGLWGNAYGAVAHGAANGRTIPFHDLVETPHLSFWLDAPHWAHQGGFAPHFRTPIVAGRYGFHLVNNEGTGREMAEVLGFTNVLPLPYGIDPEHFSPRGAVPRYDLVFCLGPGAPPPTASMRAALEDDEPDEDALRRELIPGLAARLREEVAPLLPEPGRAAAIAALEALLPTQVADRHRPMLERLDALAAADAGLADGAATLRATPLAWIRGSAIVRAVEAHRRAFAIAWLARRFRCAIFGDPSLDAWECAADRLGHPKHAGQSDLYALGLAGLNVMRWQDDQGVNPKPLEIAASGVPCLCERRAGAAELLAPDVEALHFDRLPEAAMHLHRLRDDRKRRDAIGAAARARIERDHCWRHRAEALLGVIEASTPRSRG